MRHTSFFLHCLSSLGLCRLILFWQPWFYMWQVAEMQQQGDMQLSSIFWLMANIRWLSAIQSPALHFTGYLLIPRSFLLGLIPWMWLEWFAAGPQEQYNPVLYELLLQHFYPCQTGWCGCRTCPQTPLYLLVNSVFLLANWTTTMYNFCISLIVILIFLKTCFDALILLNALGIDQFSYGWLDFQPVWFSPFIHFCILP